MTTENQLLRDIPYAFLRARESCPNYTGIKDDHDSRQCTHDDNRGMGDWCAMDCCPLLRQHARDVGAGWN